MLYKYKNSLHLPLFTSDTNMVVWQNDVRIVVQIIKTAYDEVNPPTGNLEITYNPTNDMTILQ